MGMLDNDNYTPRYTPPMARMPKAQDNTKALNSIGEDCPRCLWPIEECTCPKEDEP